MKTKYIKITTELIECRACQGKGYKDENFYHNQVKRCKCYLCQGTGKLEAENQVDVTPEIIAMQNELKKLKSNTL
jgi:DnaJ-class molecular chaperone